MSASARDTIAKWLWEKRLPDRSLLGPNNKWEFIGPDRQSAPLRDAGDILAALSAAGFVIVPREPTSAMRRAADERRGTGHPHVDIYRAMLSAAEGKK